MENNFKHTKGPWSLGYSRDGKVALVNNGRVAEVELDDNQDGEANSKLIAAAPELLEALQELADQVAQDCSIGSDPKYLPMLEKWQKAAQAIKKATE